MSRKTWFQLAWCLLLTTGGLAHAEITPLDWFHLEGSIAENMTVDSPVIHEVAILAAEDTQLRDLFGSSLAIDGDTVLVGAVKAWHPSGTNNTGAAYVFVRDAGSWVLQAKLVAPDAMAGDGFGGSVAIEGDVAVVGAPGDDLPEAIGAGSAHVFVRDGVTWTQQVQLIAEEPAIYDEFGTSVAISGDTIVVGAQLADQPGIWDTGALYVFIRSGDTWIEQSRLVATDAVQSDQLGGSVSIDGDTVIGGASRRRLSYYDYAGVAFVFVRTESGWSEQAKLQASDPNYGAIFGSSATISGDYAIIGAFGDNHSGLRNPGAAYVFRRSGEEWSQQEKLIASDPGTKELFGCSVALSGTLAAIGALADYQPGASRAGAVYLFVREGEEWIEQAKLVASDCRTNQILGTSLGMSGSTIVAGAPFTYSPGPNDFGSVYEFYFNRPPVARCADVSASTGLASCDVEASIDNGSFDPEGEPVSVEQYPPGPYGLGDTMVTLTVEDIDGATETCQALVTVTDGAPPVVECAVSQSTLWPPNHAWIDVGFSFSAADACDGVLSEVDVRITSDEPAITGSGKNALQLCPDAEVDPLNTVRLRSERAGAGDGRVYMITIDVADLSGNVGRCETAVEVPHSQGRNHVVIDGGQLFDATTCVGASEHGK